MPEGDTLHRVAFTLGRALTGQRLTRARLVERSRGDGLGPQGLRDADSPLVDVEKLDGAGVRSVEARGKNLLVHLDDERTLCTHLGMDGAWHLYRVGERWRSSARAMVTLETAERVAVCFRPTLVQLVPTDRLSRVPTLRGLGPDLLAPGFDLSAAVPRFASRREDPIGVAVMDQRIVAGIGNVYKSETLFVERVNPFARVVDLDPDRLAGILRRARALMARNLTGFPRRTRPVRGRGERREGLWVYERSGKPCRACGARIGMRRQGDLGRSTYFCPACQGVDES